MADKQILAKYVHDALDIETHIHTLEKISKEINDRASNIVEQTSRVENEKIKSSKNYLELKTNNLEKVNSNYQETRKKLSKKRDATIDNQNCTQSQFDRLSKETYWTHIDYGLIARFLIITTIVFPIAYLSLGLALPNFGVKNLNETVYFIVGIFIYLVICIFIIGKEISLTKAYFPALIQSYEQDLVKLNDELISIDNEIRKLDEEYSISFDYHNGFVVRAQEYLNIVIANSNNNQVLAPKIEKCLYEQLEAINKIIIFISKQRDEFYSLNLIPPDYRSLECVIAFDQMFRNDLVDNMREAALLYDERVFRGEMMKGLDNIYNAINELSGLMSETVAVLRSIESNTERMCDELMDISSNLVRMNANVTGHLSTISSNLEIGLGAIADSQNSIASELEYSRYANDAIRANSDRMIWYAEQRRQGLL